MTINRNVAIGAGAIVAVMLFFYSPTSLTGAMPGGNEPCTLNVEAAMTPKQPGEPDSVRVIAHRNGDCVKEQPLNCTLARVRGDGERRFVASTNAPASMLDTIVNVSEETTYELTCTTAAPEGSITGPSVEHQQVFIVPVRDEATPTLEQGAETVPVPELG